MCARLAELEIQIGVSDRTTPTYRVKALLSDGSEFGPADVHINREALLAARLEPERYGRTLFEALFGPLGDAYSRAAGTVASAGAGRLRVRLRIDRDAAELHALPWERLHHPLQGQWVPLAASAHTPFSRYVGLPIEEPSPLDQLPVRLLIAVSNPPDLPPGLHAVDVEAEVRSLAEALGDLRRAGRLAVTLLAGRTDLSAALRQRLEETGYHVQDGPTTLDRLLRRLGGQHVLHFVGHGFFQRGQATGEGEAALYLEKEEPGDATPWEPVPDTVLVPRLTVLTPGLPHLVFLTACESARQEATEERPFVGLGVKLVQAGVPAVVAMQEKVPMELARQFAQHFYRRLLKHGTADRAANEARGLVFDPAKTEWAIPVLFMRLREGQLFADPGRARPLLREYFAPLLENRTRLFDGREQEVRSLCDWVAGPDGGYRVVTGEIGVGKTALMARLATDPALDAAYHFFTPTYGPDGLSEDFFLRNVVEQLARWYGETEPLPEGIPELRGRCYELLRRTPDRQRLLVLDGLDEVLSWKLAPYLSLRLPDRLHVLLTVRDVGQDWATEYQLPAEQTTSLRLGGLTREGVRQVLLAAGPRGAEFGRDERLLDAVFQASVTPGHEGEPRADPFYVRVLVEDVEAGELTPARIGRQPRGLANYLDGWWQGIKQLAGDAPTRELFGTLAAALGPIPRSDLEAINPSLAESWAVDFFDEVLQKVRRFVTLVPLRFGDVGEDGYVLLHPRLREYVRGKLRKAYDGQLLAYCARWQEHHSSYALAHYAQHLLAAERKEDLHALIGRPWREALYQATGSDRAFAEDVERAVGAAAAESPPALLPLVRGCLVAAALRSRAVQVPAKALGVLARRREPRPGLC
jgi:hypothetical protein